jgi:choline kinase
MQVVLLAAGLGSRLGALTEEVPKALIEVAGEPLLGHAIGFAQRLEPREILVVGGFGFEAVTATVARRGWPVTLLQNPAFRDGNLVSLMTARPRIDDELLLMNVDHIYRGPIAELVRPPASEVTAFVDRDRQLGADDMKVAQDGEGRIRSISKTLAVFDCGYVGMTKVPAEALPRYWAAADAALAAAGRAIHVERVLAQLAESGTPPHCRDVSGIGWLEVDLPEERDRAEEVLRAGGW